MVVAESEMTGKKMKNEIYNNININLNYIINIFNKY